MKIARNGATSQSGINQLAKFTTLSVLLKFVSVIYFFYKFMLKKDMLVGYLNPRVNRNFFEDVIAGVITKF